MAKKAKKPAAKPAPVPVVEVVQRPAGWEKYFPYLITALFFGLSLVGILHHELWRDEYQAWMVAADAHTLPELMQNLKYEGHPPLWHLILYVITAITDDPFGMQLIHILISSSIVFLFSRYAPFPVWIKIIFAFGYYTFFEYNLISRGYGLELLLIVIFCILYANRKKYILLMAGVLFLLTQINIFGVILASCLSLILFMERISVPKKSKALRISYMMLGLYAVIVGAGILLGYSQIKAEPDNSFPVFYITHFDPERTALALTQLFIAYFSFPDVTTFHFWNTNFFVAHLKPLTVVLSPLLFLLWIMAFLRHRWIALLYITGTLILLALYYYTGLVWSRYTGHVFLFLIACCWLAYAQPEKPYQNSWVDSLALLGSRIRTPLLVAILAVHFCGGVYAYMMDLRKPFSTSAQASAYIRDNHLDEYEMIGSKDYVVSPLVTQLNRKILYAERKEYGSFIIYDQKRTNIWSFGAVQSFVEEIMKKGEDRVILVKSSEIMKTYTDTKESEPWKDDMLTDNLKLKWLTTINPGIVEDEVYYIYVVDRVK